MIDLEVFVKEEVQAALASAGQSFPLVLEGDPSAVRLLVGNNEIEWSRLISTFESIERHSGFIYNHLREQNAADETMRRMLADGAFERLTMNRKSAIRKAATMRDSAGQLARLLKGKNLDTDPDEEMTGASRHQREKEMLMDQHRGEERGR